jgi:hypothetical protein
MHPSSQFDQNEAIARWRSQLAETGALFEADLDELESHLLDHIEASENGEKGEDAFNAAVRELGDTRSLANEFAKINPLLAWRAALFWICLGIMIVFTGRPIQEIAGHGVVVAGLELHLGRLVTAALMWFVVLGTPPLTFALVLHVAKKHLEEPLPWARSPAFRMGLVLTASLLMLVAHLGAGWGIFTYFEYKLFTPDMRADWTAADQQATYAYYVLAVVAPLYLGWVAYRQRARVLRAEGDDALTIRAAAAPLFWLAIGLFVGSIRCELHLFVRSAAMTTGALVKLGAEQMTALMWIVTLACPLLLFLSTYAYLRHRAPGPSQVLRTRAVLLALAISGAMGIAAVFATGSVTHKGYSMLPLETVTSGYMAWVFAGIVTSTVLPVVIGTLLYRLRPSARLAAFRAAD